MRFKVYVTLLAGLTLWILYRRWIAHQLPTQVSATVVYASLLLNVAWILTILRAKRAN